MRQPVGPCVLITPWNFPLAMGTRKIGPAIAAGCTMVMKPAKQTPLSMLALAQILEEAGLPGGVLNVITASSSGSIMEPLIKDFRTRKLSFTGSTEVGRKLMEQASEQLLRVSMELGGNAPFLVFDDADIDDAVEGAVIAKMRNVGEACTAANRFHVAESIGEEFAEKLAEKIGAMKVGRGTEEGSEVGPLIDEDQRSKVAELVEDATGKGAKVLVGGSQVDGQGYFYEPTVLSDVRPRTRRCCARRSSARSRRWRRSSPRRTRSQRPTTPSTAWSPTSSRATSSARYACARASRPAWSASTRGWSRTRRRRSAA